MRTRLNQKSVIPRLKRAACHWSRVPINRARRMIIPKLLHFRARHGVFAVTFKTPQGLGGKLTGCLEVLLFCQERNLVPNVQFDERGHNTFGEFFELVGYPKGSNTPTTSIWSMHELGFPTSYNRLLTLESAGSIVSTHLRVREHVLSEVREYVSANFGSRRVLGVHYRGTDKFREAPPIDYDTVRRSIQEAQERCGPFDLIFVSTDDTHLLQHLGSRIAGVPIVSRNDSRRSESGEPIHLSRNVDPVSTTRDALVNCLILSRTSLLLKSSSYLSAWSKLFNPTLPVVFLNQPYAEALRFPEREMLSKSLWAPL